MNQFNQQLKGINIYLIGMMGCGKTTVGQALAKALNYRFLDTDQLITQVAGQSITDIFAQSGVAEFRAIESKVLSQLCAYQRMVVATGGGIVLERMNWSYLRYGLIVWLDVPVEQLYHRLKGDTTRPLLQESDPLATLQNIFNQRKHLYQTADLRIEVDPADHYQQVMQKILTGIPTVTKSPDQPLTKSPDINQN
ncbi:MAG: shikimate kinase [Microcoleaceae cyanobacterium]